MRVISKLFACAAVVALSGWVVPAEAASPASGTLSKSKKTVTWNGSFTASHPWPVSGCAGTPSSPFCDYFNLKVDLGEGAKIKVSFPGQTATDLDLFVYSPTGALLGESGNLPGDGEAVEFTHHARYRKKAYIVEVRPFLVVPGTSYKGTAKVLVLGAK